MGECATVHVSAHRCLRADREAKPGHMLIRCCDDGAAEGCEVGGTVGRTWGGGKKGKERQREEMRRWGGGGGDRKWRGESSPNCKSDW